MVVSIKLMERKSFWPGHTLKVSAAEADNFMSACVGADTRRRAREQRAFGPKLPLGNARFRSGSIVCLTTVSVSFSDRLASSASWARLASGVN